MPTARRRFLAALMGLSAAAALPMRRAFGGRRSADLAARLAGIYHEPESAAAIGRRYLALTPAEAAAGPAELAAQIVPEAGSAALARVADERLRALIAARHVEDFAAGRTVSLDGWILSRTEARLCALAALQRDTLLA